MANIGAIHNIWWHIENKTTDVSKAPKSEAKASATEKLRSGKGRDVPQTMVLSISVIREETGILCVDSKLSQTVFGYSVFLLMMQTD